LAKKFKKKVDLKFRDFAYRDDRGASTYKFTWHANKYIKAKYGMIPIQIEFMLFAYDLEFFTIEWMAKQLVKSYNQTKDWLTVKLKKKGFLYDYFSKDDIDIHKDTSMWFREENRWNYRKRYALTQEGRRIVEEWVAIVNGTTKIDLEYDFRAVNTEIMDRAEGIPTKVLGRKLKGHEDTPLGKKIIERAKLDGRGIGGILPPSKPQRGE
jgi:hypothetical protein